MKKPVVIFLVLSVLVTFSTGVYGGTDQDGAQIVLTLNDCMDRAVEYNHQGAILEQQIDELWKQHNKLFEMSHAIQKQLDTIDRYTKLYEKSTSKSLTIEEQGELLMYESIFGPKPPVYSSSEMFEQFIKNRDFPHYSIWGNIQNLTTSRKLIDTSVKTGVKQLFDGIIDMQDAITLQEQLYDNMKKQNEQMLVRYGKGLISDVDKYISDCSLEKQRLSIEKLKRNIDNMKMVLKQQIGVPLRQEIKLSYNEKKGIKLANTYATYLKKALDERSEVFIAKMDLQVAQRENDIMKQYITNELLAVRMESDMALEEKRIAYDEAVNNVTLDISSGYKDVQVKLSDFYVSIEQFQNAEKQYKEAEMKYKNGMISLSDIWNFDISYTQAKIGYNKAMRDCNNALYNLETACGIGPGYSKGEN